MPGASPPDVKTAILFISLILYPPTSLQTKPYACIRIAGASIAVLMCLGLKQVAIILKKPFFIKYQPPGRGILNVSGYKSDNIIKAQDRLDTVPKCILPYHCWLL